jgi:hypothetical protein
MTADADGWSWGLAGSRGRMAAGLFGFSLPFRTAGEEIVRIRLGFRRADAEFAEVDARDPASLRRWWNLKDSVAWLADPKWATLLSATVVPPVLAGEE